ncbi:MAG: hypothetical protein FWE32_05090 [Oscillospiraceae bacterium]|nr:hypothetical protein [Oscillospiraceae bacterium]
MPLDYKHIAKGADAFCNAWKNYYENKDNNAEPDISVLPYVVNVAFACELYMKAIIIHEADISKREEVIKKIKSKKVGHNLQILFKMLSVGIQQRIKSKIPDSLIKQAQDEEVRGCEVMLKAPNISEEAKTYYQGMIDDAVSTFDEMLQRHVLQLVVHGRLLHGAA